MGKIDSHARILAQFPVNLVQIDGAFLFSVGMKLASACGCGTLYTAGIASRRMLAVIHAFMVGVLGVLAGTAARPPAIDAIAINWGSVSLANELS